ncbi:MAG: hypothetical protein NC415_02315 [bacterium]|nr:hypothetical protein [bacterium]
MHSFNFLTIGYAYNVRNETYLLDLTRPYHNLLGMVRGETVRNSYWDENVTVMSEMPDAEKAGMTTSAGHTLRRRGNISRRTEGSRRMQRQKISQLQQI